MSGRGRGGRGQVPPAEHRSYEDYDDSYAAPKVRGGRLPPQQYGERGQRPGYYEGPPPNHQPQYYPHANGGRDYSGPPGPSNRQQGWGQMRPSRAPYTTGHQRQNQEQQQYQVDESQRALTERGTRWSGSGGGRPPSSGGGGGRPPSAGSGGGGGRQLSTGRAGGGAGRPPSANNGRRLSSSSGGGGRQPSNDRSGCGRPPSGDRRGTSNDRAGGGDRTGGSARPRAPYVTAAGAGEQLLLLTAPAADVPSEPELPSNPHFLTPAFPQPPRTRTDSCITWALMVEASSQTLEAVVGPFLEGALMELFGESWERELFNLELALPPFTAAACAELVSRCKQLHERLPITIHKRVEAVGKATAALATSPSFLEPEDVTAAQSAMKGMLQDCIKAMKMPSLLGPGWGSRQFQAFATDLLPHAESTVVYYEMLLADCMEAAAARQQARGAATGEADGAVVEKAEVAEVVASP